MTHPFGPNSTAIIVPVVALLSTALGATIVAFTSYVLAVRRERSERERDNRVHAVEVKRAARLIDLELLKAQSLAGIAINKRYWILEADAQISSDVWRQYDVTISAELSYQTWVLVAKAFLAAEHINGSRALQLSGVLRDQPISDDNAQTISVMQTDVSRRREAKSTEPFRFCHLQSGADLTVA